MPSGRFTQSSRDGLTATAYPSGGSVLVAFNLDEKPGNDFAGFAVRCTPPHSRPYYLVNRLSFEAPITSATKPLQRLWTPSNLAPFQKFRWVDFPADIKPGDYIYQVTAMHFKTGGGLKPGASVQLSFEMTPEKFDDFELGFTRGYLSSQAYAVKFKNAPIRPAGKKTIDFDTSPFEKQYEWLGFYARKMVFDFLREAIADTSVTVDVFAYDLDEPDVIRSLAKLGKRLRLFLDNAALHAAPGDAEVQALAVIARSAGADHVRTGHFKRFAHNKVFIQKKNGTPIKVLTGSANFSVRGLYVQANNVLTFNDPHTASLYETAFNQAFDDPTPGQSGFAKSEIAGRYFEIQGAGLPQCSVAFSPHADSSISLNRIAEAIDGADSSVMFAIMELGGTGPVLERIRNLDKQRVFTYGVTQSSKGLGFFKAGSSRANIVPFAYLEAKVPEPFKKEWSGGQGQVVHHKFVVVDFNDSDPILFTGSSNLAAGGEKENGDNLIAISDPGIAAAYAVEAVRLLDHYDFRRKMQGATSAQPLRLRGPDDNPRWWAPYFDPNHIKFKDRLLFSKPADG